MTPSVRALITGFFTALAGAILVLTPIGADFEKSLGLTSLFLMRGPIPAPENIVVVSIDDQTGGQLGLSRLPREWPRSVHGHLVENLTKLGVSIIVFDFDFQQPKTEQDDLDFAAAIGKSGRVVLAEKLVGKRQPIFSQNGEVKGSVWLEQRLKPIPPLAKTAKALGPFPLPKVDVAVHEFWAFKQSVGDEPTIPSAALQVYALAAFEHLVEVLDKSHVWETLGLPRPPQSSARADEVSALMHALRERFVRFPDVPERILDFLQSERAKELNPSERELVKALVGLYGGDDHRYLNFYGPPGTITTISYHSVVSSGGLEGKALPDLHGKAVFVGFSDLYDPGQPDRFYTVFTNDYGVDLSGVEIAATAFGNLMTNRSLRTLQPILAVAVLCLFGFMIGVLAYRLPALTGVPLSIALAAGYAALAQCFFNVWDLWLPIATPMLVQFPLALFVGLIAQYFSERGKKDHATRAISLYLPEHLAREFTENSLDRSALDQVTFSVCFASDMAGFTSIAEKLRPKELAKFLNDYFDSLSESLRRHRVDVMEFRADGIMCAWTGEPTDMSLNNRALDSALEAVEVISRFKERYSLLSQSLRIGLESGTVYLGHAGGGGHFVYSIIGDCANTAARIEGLNKHLGTQILASRAIVEGVDGLVTRYLGDFRFVGKTEPLSIYEVMARTNQARDSVLKLSNHFTVAMEILTANQWEKAGKQFEAILRDYPSDGPAKFHLARCRQFSQQPPKELPWIINMDSK